MARKRKETKEIVVVRPRADFRKLKLHIVAVWVKRFVERGAEVQVFETDDHFRFVCPDYITELHVEMLCDRIRDRGFAGPLFQKDQSCLN